MRRISSGSVWEEKSGYSRAVVANGLVFVSATAATTQDGSIIAAGDIYGQTKAILEKLESVLAEAGSSLKSVVQTRIYLSDITNWEPVGKAHKEVFSAEPPAMSLVHVKPFVDSDMLVEIELVAAVE